MKTVLSAFILLVCAGAALVSNSQTANKPTTNDVKIRQRMSMGGAGGVEVGHQVSVTQDPEKTPGAMIVHHRYD